SSARFSAFSAFCSSRTTVAAPLFNRYCASSWLTSMMSPIVPAQPGLKLCAINLTFIIDSLCQGQVLDRIRAGVEKVAVELDKCEKSAFVELGIPLVQPDHAKPADAPNLVAIQLTENERNSAARKRATHRLIDRDRVTVDAVRRA